MIDVDYDPGCLGQGIEEMYRSESCLGTQCKPCSMKIQFFLA